MATKPCCVSVKVSTELEARCILAPHFILFFAA
ncbi:host cell division inhibitor Icd-like protein [Photorhabdus sp. APURE]|nr:host cell division inhibitor Icd-like protein [Photorhabdus aballayi]MCW7548673.1 host cell division inhibitor Icd-like protein [Photorhabdus aballayi]